MKKKSMRTILVILALVVMAIINRMQSSSGYDAPAEPAVFPIQGEVSSLYENDGYNHWGRQSTLQDHFDRHGPDFDAESPEAYARLAHELYLNREDYQVKIAEDGTVRIYDSETNTFGAYNKDGTTKSFYKPSDGQRYFDRQPGKSNQ